MPSNLPLQLTSFIGREREIAEVRRLLGTTRLLMLTGSGGCGKTRLALQVGASLADAQAGDGEYRLYADGVWLVDLAPLSDPSLVPQSVASIFDLREGAETSISEILKNYLRTKNLLLVLDNCEHLIQVCAQLCDELLHAAPDLKILATSREAMNIAGETTFRVPSLTLPTIQSPVSNLQALMQYESLCLFIERAQAATPEFELQDANALAVAQICQRLDGIPLAIELAAARVNVIPIEEISARLDDCFRLLTSGNRTAMPRYQTLRASIDWSYNLLSDAERALLRRLAVFVGGFTLDAAERICIEEDRNEVLDLLSRLVQKSLVVVKLDERPRYRLLETIRQYAREKLDATDEAEWVRNRHSDFYLEWLHQNESELKDCRQLDALAKMDLETENARAAWTHALSSNRLEPIAPATNALMLFFSLRGRLSEGRELCEEAWKSVNLTPHASLRAQILAWKGQFEEQLGQTREAEATLQQCLDILKLADDSTIARSVKSFALLELGRCKLLIGERERAKQLYGESLAGYQDLDDQWSIANVLSALGNLAWNLAHYTEAEQRYRESLAIRQTIGDRRGIAEVLMGLGNIYTFSGRFEEAKRLNEESLAIYREMNDQIGIAQNFLYIASTYFFNGDFPKAIENLEQAIALHQELGTQSGVAWCSANLGWACLLLGQYDRARQLLEKSLSLAREIKHERGVGASLNFLGLVFYGMGDPHRANQLLAQGVEEFRQINQRTDCVAALARWGLSWRALGEADKAWQLACESLKLASEIDIWMALVNSQGLFAVMLVDRGHVERAVEVYAMLRRYPYMRNPFYESVFGHAVDAAATSLPAEVVAAAQARGQSLDIHETARQLVIEFSLAWPILEPRAKTSTQTAKEKFGGLTPREREVAVLIAQGKTNPEIAEALVVSERTVSTHVSNILSKLGFTSRTQIASWATAKRLT